MKNLKFRLVLLILKNQILKKKYSFNKINKTKLWNKNWKKNMEKDYKCSKKWEDLKQVKELEKIIKELYSQSNQLVKKYYKKIKKNKKYMINKIRILKN